MTTLPAEGSGTVTVVQLTDPHLFASTEGKLLNVNTHHSLKGVLDEIVQQQAKLDWVLATGDISQDGSQAAYQRFKEMTEALPASVGCLPGNHDDRDAFHQALRGHTHPIIDLGNWRVIMLDTSIPNSNAGNLADDQLELLRTSVNQAGSRHVLVAMHHNPVPVDSPWLDTMMVANADQLFQTLQQLPQVKAVIWGHVHQEYDAIHAFTEQHTLRLLATPSTCVQFTPRSEKFSLDTVAPGYRWLGLHPDGQLDTGVVRVAGLGLRPDAQSGGY